MITRNQAAGQQQQQSRRRTSGGGGGSRLPYLKVENVSFQKREAEILSTRIEDDNFKPNGPQVVSVRIAFAGNTYLWTLRQNNPNLDILCDAFTEDETTWTGKKFFLYLETDSHTNNNLIRAEVSEEQIPAKKKRG